MRLLRRHFAFGLILAAFLGLAITYSVVNPLFESPDEVWHYEYVRWLSEGHGLPAPEDVGHAPWHQEGSQPPLYYLTAAALTWWIPTDNAPAVIRYNPHGAIGQAASPDNRNMMAHGPAEAWPWRGAALGAHAARFYSVFLGALTVLFTYMISLRAFPQRRWSAVLAAALVAFNPQFIFISAAVNNDNLVTAASAAGLWLLIVVLTAGAPDAAGAPGRQRPPTTLQVILLGALAGIAALSKLSGLLLAPFVGLVLMIVAWRMRSWQALVRWGVTACGAFLVVAGWWYVRNWLLFGDPLLLSAMFAILPRRPEPPTLAELLARGQGVWRSFWAVFGWFNVVAPSWLYQFYTGLTLAGLGGLVAGPWLQRVYGSPGRDVDADVAASKSLRRLALVVLAVWALLILLLLIRWATMRYPQGRLLFPAISALAVLLAFGLTNWLPPRVHPILVGAVAIFMFVVAALIPWRTIAPVYAPPAPLPASATVPNPLDDVVFVTPDGREQLRLRGFAVGAEEVIPGEALEIELYWEALVQPAHHYSVFVHLTDENQILQAQRDSYPGGGSAPTGDWAPGTIVPDRHVVQIPLTVPAPARLKIDVGLYDYATGQRLLVGGHDHWTIGYITLLPPPSDSGFPHPVRINFDDKMALIGFEFDRRVVAPGEVLGVTLWWEALAEMEIDYKVFVHYVLPPEATWAQKDDDPQDGAAPTSGWIPGAIVEDRYEIALPAEAPAGVYFVEIGVYDKATNDRLQVNFSDKGIVLGQFRVESPD